MWKLSLENGGDHLSLGEWLAGLTQDAHILGAKQLRIDDHHPHEFILSKLSLLAHEGTRSVSIRGEGPKEVQRPAENKGSVAGIIAGL